MDKEAKREYDRQYHIKNAEKRRANTAYHKQKNKHSRWQREKVLIESNPKMKLYKTIQTLLKRYAAYPEKNRNSIYLKVLNFTPEQLIARLRSTMKPGMTWQQFIDGKIQIDHIKPNCKFNYYSTSCVQFKECWSLSNLQLLWKRDNELKAGYYDTN